MNRTLLFVLVGYVLCIGAFTSPWTTESTSPAPVQNYARHTSVAIDNYIFEFGGMTENLTTSQADPNYITHLFANTRKFNIDTNTWSSVVTSSAPSARGMHCMTAVGNNIYIFGGAKQQFAPQKDSFWVYNYVANTWTNLTSLSTNPQTRIGCAMHPYLDGFFMFGGVIYVSESGHLVPTETNDLYYYNQTTSTWSHITTTGAVPSIRSFTRLHIPDTHPRRPVMLLFGGEAGDAGTGDVFFVNDLYSLDLTTFAWTTVTPAIPVGRTRMHYSSGVFQGKQWIHHSGDYGNCQPLVLLVPGTLVYDIQKNAFYDGVVPAYAAELGPPVKGGQLTCFDTKCYQTGGFSGVECTMSQQTYINYVSSYEPDNRAFNFARSFEL